jgi:hypothetical protein
MRRQQAGCDRPTSSASSTVGLEGAQDPGYLSNDVEMEKKSHGTSNKLCR